MRTLKITLFSIGIVALVSCNNPDKKNAEKDNYASETPDNNMDNRADDKLVGDNVTINDEYLTLNTENMRGMYKYLDMSIEQIENFEDDYNKRIKNMRNNNNDMSFGKEKLQNLMDQSLEPVLSSEQYQKYEQWKKDYPNI
ncbi:MAG: hypothetical protein ACTIJ9_04430 [Aequorivita sp.]